MNNAKLPKRIVKLIFISLFVSLLLSIYITYKYDKFESDNVVHSMVKGDAHPIWKRAAKLKKDLLSGKDYLSSGSELHRSYLPVRTIAFFSIIFDYKLFSDQDTEKIKIDKKKLLFLIFQSLLYFQILFYFLKKLQNFLDADTLFYCALFLCLCPSILLFHSSFHTESIFFSLQLLFLFYIIKPSSKILINILYGLILGLMFLQKTVGLFYIFLIVFFFVFNFKQKALKPIIFLSISYIFVLLFVGYGNFKRIGVFYFQPTQANNAPLWYLGEPILSKGMNLSIKDARLKIKNDNETWIKKNNIDLKLEIDRLAYGKYQKKYALDLILNYPVVSIKHIGWKSMQTAMMSPFYVFHYYYWEQTRDNKFYLTKSYKQIWWPINIFYSLIIYILVLIGFINSFKILDLKLNFLFISSALYMFGMLGWVGHDRYMVPSLIYLAIYFGIGVMVCKKKIKNNNFN